MSTQTVSFSTFKEKVFAIVNILRGEVDVHDYLPIIVSTLFLKKSWHKSIGSMTLNEIIAEIDLILSSKELDIAELRAYTSIQFFFLPASKKLGAEKLNALLIAVDDLDSAAISNYFSDVVEAIVVSLNKVMGRLGEASVQTAELTRFLLMIADLHAGDKVYNPFAGMASFGLQLPEGVSYFGQEVNESVHLQGLCRLFARYEGTKWPHFAHEDSIKKWNAANERYELIISNPPFNMRIDAGNTFGKSRTAEQFMLNQGINALSETGKLIVITAQGILSGGGADKEIRKGLVERDLLEMVISFPGGLLSNTSISISVLVINAGKKDKGLVKFVNASNYTELVSARERKLDPIALYDVLVGASDSESVRIVSNDVLAAEDYNLIATRYFIPQLKASGIRRSHLGYVLEPAPVMRQNDAAEGRVIRIKDLQNDRLDFKLKTEELIVAPVPKQFSELKTSALLVALKWQTLKPTYFEYTGESIFIGQDIVPLIVSQEVDLSYLIIVLHSAHVLETISYLREGTTIPSLKKEDLFRIEVELPSIEEQRARVKEIHESFIAEKKREIEARSRILGLENELLEQNTYLRHALAGPANNLRGSIRNLKKILEDQIIPLLPDVLKLKLGPASELTLENYMTIMERDARRISETLNRTTWIEAATSEKTMTPIEIFEFLENYTNELKAQSDIRYKIDFSYDKDAFTGADGTRIKTYIYANADLLTDLFNNLIKNAEVHAFSETASRVSARRSRPGKYDHNRIEIYIMLNADKGVGMEEEKDVIILVSNTGKGFPENFTMADFTRKGSKTGSNAGDGFGGWYINEIVKKFGGDLDMIDEQGGEGLPDTDLATSFEITLPITQFEGNESV